jgi:opacity protein-like surface antigen
MIRLIARLATTSLLFCSSSYASFEVGVFYGKSFQNTIGTINAKDGGGFAGISIHAPGTEAKLGKKPGSSDIFGIDATYSFNNFVGINLDFSYSKYSIKTGEATLFVPGQPPRNINFPAFDVKTYALKPSMVFKINHSGFEFYSAFGVPFGFMKMNNTFFSVYPSEYGIGGNESGMFFAGLGLKLGALYDVVKNFKIGLEYGLNFYHIMNTNQQMRSFNRGFSANLSTQYVAAKIVYSFK